MTLANIAAMMLTIKSVEEQDKERRKMLLHHGKITGGGE